MHRFDARVCRDQIGAGSLVHSPPPGTTAMKASSAAEASPKTMRSGTVKNYIAKAMADQKLVVVSGKDMTYQSHCAGMDAPAYALQAIGIRRVCALASECDKHAALFHLMNHPKTKHLAMDVKDAAAGCGECFTHGGAVCDWASKDVDLLCSSFVCKPFSRANGSRKEEPMGAVGNDPAVDMFYHTRSAIKAVEPRVFLLENVDGIADNKKPMTEKTKPTKDTTKTKPTKDTTMHVILNDPEHGLCTIEKSGTPLYHVQVKSGIGGDRVGSPQARPRTLIFGVRADLHIKVSDVVKTFEKLLDAYGNAGPAGHIDDFLTETLKLAAAVPHTSQLRPETLEEHSQYCAELSKSFDSLRQKRPELKDVLLPSDQRPSKRVRLTASHRVQATIDAVAVIENEHTTGCRVDVGCRCHLLADVSQRADRVRARCDGAVPTLMTNSAVFSYKHGIMIHPRDFVASMGYPSPNMTFVPMSAARTLAGNGYLVPVCACALVALFTATGHVKNAGS